MKPPPVRVLDLESWDAKLVFGKGGVCGWEPCSSISGTFQKRTKEEKDISTEEAQ